MERIGQNKRRMCFVRLASLHLVLMLHLRMQELQFQTATSRDPVYGPGRSGFGEMGLVRRDISGHLASDQ